MKKKLLTTATELHNRETQLARQQRALEVELRNRKVASIASIAKATGRVILSMDDLIVDWNATK